MHIMALINRALASGVCAGMERLGLLACTRKTRCECGLVVYVGFVTGGIAAVSAVTWASSDTQRSLVQVGLDCAATDPDERETVEGARARLLALAEGMPGYTPPAAVRAAARTVRRV
jgi:hypothetical protein